MTPIAPHITAFFEERLPIERRASENTRDSYAYAFQLLLTFASKRLKAAPSRLALEQIDAPLVVDFLNDLETTRGNGPSSRNIRLAAIKSFMHFMEYRVPSAMEQFRRILAIPVKKTESRLVRHLTTEETQAILDAPDPTGWSGIRDRAMLHLCYAGAIRVSELISLRLDDLKLQPQANVLIHGKECHSYCIFLRPRHETTGKHTGQQACDLAFSLAAVLRVVRRGIGLGPYTDAHGASRVEPMSEPYPA
jgi:site-specific recombinase XerD